MHAVLPAKTVLAVIAALCAGLFFAAAARHDPLLPAVGLGLLVLSAILLGGVYPATVEQFSVKPHELARETSYLDRQLAGTAGGVRPDPGPDQHLPDRNRPGPARQCPRPAEAARPGPATARPRGTGPIPC